ncbi:autocrine motility factor receptor [Cricetulus griseus]
MPLLFLERFPWPSLRTYTGLSGLALLGTIVSAYRALSQPEAGSGEPEPLTASLQPEALVPPRLAAGGPRARDVAQYLLSDSLFVWVLVNTACCVLMLVAKLIQCIVFGPLRVSERQHLKDKFWNFIFYKFIFIFGVLNVQTVEEVVMWCLWFAGLVFLHLMVQLCKDRFEYLSFSPTTPMSSHGRVLSLLIAMLLSCCGLAVVCCVTGYTHGMHTLAFMAAESLLVTVRTAHVILRYVIHLWDLNHEGTWEGKGTYVYYTDFVMELTLLSLDLMHHIHMLLFGNIWLSMASLVIFMQLRYLFHEVQRRIRRHKNYLRVRSDSLRPALNSPVERPSTDQEEGGASLQTERVPLDLSPRLEETLDFSEVEVEPSEVEDFEARGSRFSKSADERQRMLVQRKDDLLQQARKRFLNKSSEDDMASERLLPSEGTSSDPVTLRRRMLAAAAERRLQRQQTT